MVLVIILQRKISIITGSRADFAPMKYVIEQLGEQCLHLSLDGMYDREAQVREFLTQNKPDIVCVLGDRYEIAITALVAAEMAIPIAHISGGEETEGATDNQFRHAITKLAYWHFVAHQDFADKVISMGEHPDTLFVTGDPQIDSLTEPLLTLAEIEKTTGIHIEKPFLLICQHPDTLSTKIIARQIHPIYSHINLAQPRYKTIIASGANADQGGDEINDLWQSSQCDFFHYRPTFTHAVWRALLHHADVLIGNSSSFCIEGMTLGKKIIMIGDRQKGRWEQSQRHFAKNKFAYGEPGKVSPKIVDLLKTLPIPENPRKPFYSA